MTDFTKHELQTLAAGLDAVIRAEGHALGQAGINGLNQSLGGVNLRFTSAVSAHAKITQALQDIEAKEKAEAAVADSGKKD